MRKEESIWDTIDNLDGAETVEDTEIESEATVIEEEEDMKNVTPEDQIPDGAKEAQEISVQGFSQEFASRKEATEVMDLLDTLGYADNAEVSSDGKTVTLYNVSDRDLSIIQRKINIATWSSRTIAISTAVTNFATDIADYALNGALAPTAGAVINAGFTAGRVVATAGAKVASATLASGIRNTRAACKEVYNSAEIQDAWNEIKGVGTDIGGLLFGSKGIGTSGKWKATA